MKFFYYATLMKLWNPRFLSDYITTIGNTIYVPDVTLSWVDLAHEYVHIHQYNTRGAIKYTLQYLFPQVLAIFSLLAILAIFNLWFLLFLIFLLFLAPWPAPWREDIELRAYASNVAYATENDLDEECRFVNGFIDRIANEFTGLSYYKMSWNRNKVLRILNDYKNFTKSGFLWAQEPYTTIRKSMNEEAQ